MREDELVQAVVAALQRLPIKEPLNCSRTKRLIPLGVSARHVHLAPQHVTLLFGPDYELTPRKDLQPGQFACEETVTLVGPKQALYYVRVLGPARGQTQVELSTTDCYTLGIEPVLRASGDLAGTPGIAVVGPRGTVYLTQGAIVARRHIHITPSEARLFGLGDGQLAKVRASGERGVVLEQVLVRVSPEAALELHIDTDEANSAGLKSGDQVELIC